MGGPPINPRAGRAKGPLEAKLLRRIETALQRRAARADSLSATIAGVHWQTTLRPQSGHELPRLAWGPDALWSAFATQRDGVSQVDTWSELDDPGTGGKIDVASSAVQTADRRDCVWLVLDRVHGARPPQQAQQQETTAPCVGHTWYLTALGLVGMDGAGWADRLRAPRHLDRDRTLRGHPCVVVSREDSDLWVACDLGLAPVRLVQVAPGGAATVVDWWDFLPCGPLSLPRMSSQREVCGVASGRCTASLSVSRVASLAVGADPSALRPEPNGLVQAAAGARASYLDGSRLGDQARLLNGIAEEDGAPWGVSANALSRDAGLVLPEEPRDDSAGRNTVR